MRHHLRHSSRVLWMLLVLWMPVMHSSAQETPPILLRTAVRPDSGIWVGQRVVYQLDVLAKDGWAKVRRMPDLPVSGAIVVRLETQGVRLEETIEGDAYSGQRYELLIFPQRGGEISIPPAPAEIEISQWGGASRKRMMQETAPALEFNVRTPPGAEKIQGLISTDRMSADQTWEPDATELPVGAAVLRRITRRADNVSAMAFTPLAFEDTKAFDAYPEAPNVEDRYQRGELKARRTEAVTYVFKRPGRVELPAVAITWWDLSRKALQETVLPSRTFEIEPPPAAEGAASAAAADDPPPSRRWTYGAVFILFAAVLIVRFRHRLHGRRRAWRDRRQRSEKAFFRRFVKAARKGNPAEALNGLMRWLDHIHEDNQAARLDLFLKAFSDDQGRKAADELIRASDHRASAPWRSRNLINSMARARRRWLARRPASEIGRRLPLLNPCRLGFSSCREVSVSQIRAESRRAS